MQKIFKQPMRTKRGSSLPMVLAIGLVLVIWVMGLTPIITTQGKASIDVRQQEEDYLQSRSAIEFTKGELVNMVAAQGFPETFAVVYDTPAGETEKKYTPYPWFMGVSGTGTYAEFITMGTDRSKDVPASDKVAALCTVMESDTQYVYDITITTYNNGEAGLKYSTQFTAEAPAGTIYPEAYGKTQALPLSDFVLVDGKIGENIIWYNSLTYAEKDDSDALIPNDDGLYQKYADYGHGKGAGYYYDSAFREALLPADGATDSYPNAGNVHAAFKVTAETFDPAKPDENMNVADTMVYIEKPKAPALYAGIAADGSGTVTLTLDFYGTEYANTTLATQHALYGMSTNGSTSVAWQTSNQFTLTSGGTYYFYCYIAGHGDHGNKKLYGNSEFAVSARPIQVFHYSKVPTTPDGDANKLYVVYEGSLVLNIGSGLNSVPGTYSSINAGLYEYNPTADYLWSVTKNGSNYYLRCNGMGLTCDYSTKYYMTSNPTGLKYEHNVLYTNGAVHYSLNIDGNKNYKCNLEALWTGINKISDKTYFCEIVKPADATPISDKLTYNSIAKPTVNLGSDPTLQEAREAYKSNLSGAETIYILDMGGNKFQVYAEGKSDNKFWFLELDEISLPSYVSAPGYGIAGKALYFMGDNYAINPNGEPIYLKADLLVIKDDICPSGNVYVTPYSEGKEYTMVFFVNGTDVFLDHNFYLVKKGENLAALTNGDFLTKVMHVCNDYGTCTAGTSCTAGTHIEDGIIRFCDRALTLSKRSYPVINLDIAYSTNEQLGHVVSGEATMWTQGGKLKIDSNTPNGAFVVCPYVTSVEGTLNCSANRILIMAQGSTLTIPSNATMYSRYISFDSEDTTTTIKQGNSGVTFTVKCLTKNESFMQAVLSALSQLLGTNGDYNSNTLQVDYEQKTTISLNGEESGEALDAQICRYADGSNLFDIQVSDVGGSQVVNKNEILQVEYDVSDLNSKLAGSVMHLRTVERYVTIHGDTDTLNVYKEVDLGLISSYKERDLYLYANFIAFDESVTAIALPKGGSLLDALNPLSDGDSELIINSQETGYTENEYLGFFRDNGFDIYNGTILQIKGDKLAVRKVEIDNWLHTTTYELDNGFYYIPAVNGDGTSGTSLFEIAKAYTTEGAYKITEGELYEYAQSIGGNHAFVDPGIEPSKVTVEGFGGGSMK